MRVAIVGLGPKGLFALERLVHHGADVAVDVYEPHPAPGAGPVYAPDQPGYLRMNFRADQIDMWPAGTRAVAPGEACSYVDWRPPSDRAPYPERAAVGRYLADGFALLRERLPVRLVPSRVASVERCQDGWRVDGAGPYDEVLVATGHARGWDGALRAGSTPLVPAVFPVGEWLGPDRVPPGARVAARGFALSFIDAALALTEGRGGRFDPDGRYVSSGDEPATIVPWSRTGRPMLAKPAAAPPAALEPIAAAGRAAILALPDGFDLVAGLLPIVAEVADRSGWSDAYPTLVGACQGRPPATDLGPAAELEQSIAVAAGDAPPGLAWALGHAWRAVYPALVARLGGDGLAASHWPSFRRLATHMERVAFGPPPENAAKLLALIEAGVVDVSALRDGPDPRAGVMIDTVLPGPGVAGIDDPLLHGLLAAGHARVLPQRRGIDVRADGTCIGSDGTPTAGLAAIGRPTEDAVIGNDTLSRTLHPLADLWARRVAGPVAALVA